MKNNLHGAPVAPGKEFACQKGKFLNNISCSLVP
jgi:hypothetical protein